MKKRIWIAALVACGLGFGSLSHAEDMEGMKDKGSMMKKGMMGRGMMGGMMMKEMMAKSVTATSDGGVVIVSGNQVVKYDKNLDLVKQAEIPMDMQGMKKNMEEMMKMCPMMGDMKGTGGEEGAGESSTETASSSDSDEHAAHH